MIAMPDRGVTLLELLIVTVVVAMLALVAVPAFRGQLLRTHRVEAQTALMQLAAAQERHYLQHHAYAASGALAAAPPDGLGLSATTGRGRYALSIDAADATGFAATATAIGAQAADAECATFSVDALGRRRAARRDGTPSTRCWN